MSENDELDDYEQSICDELGCDAEVIYEDKEIIEYCCRVCGAEWDEELDE